MSEREFWKYVKNYEGLYQVSNMENNKQENMETYIDHWGMYSNRPCIGGEQSSGNSFIYTAYANKLNLPLNKDKVLVFFNSTFVPYGYKGWELKRYPNIESMSGSRDEIIGAVSLGLPIKENIIKFNYRYNYQWLNYDWFKVLKGFVYITGEHRNFAQDKKVHYVYPVMFWLAWHDQYYVDKMHNGKSTMFRWLMFQLYALHTLLTSEYAYHRNVLWLQLKDMNSWFWIRFINQKENFMDEFGENHPFNKERENEREDKGRKD